VSNDRVRILGIDVHAWTMERTVSEIERRIAAREFTQHTVVNVAKIVNMHRDQTLWDAVTACDIVNVDGQGVVWGARTLGVTVPERVAGVDLFIELLGMAERRGFSVYFLGAKDDVVTECATKLQAQFPGLRIAGWHHGYFWDDEEALVKRIADSGADLLFVAITSPKKERFIDRWGEKLGVKFVMGVGGTFDVMSGRVRRAPRIVQRMGLEWAFRTAQEPRRMWRRYASTNARFAVMLIKARLGR
jgi:N-acetylglucosaminyldiphosphoundecaprenol N-acetyl-beta-D-mannosaminyltransferase